MYQFVSRTVFSALMLLPLISFGGNSGNDVKYKRWIQNDSIYTWIIVNEDVLYDQNNVLFDSLPSQGTPACGQGSSLNNGPCVLEPGQRTYVQYVAKDNFKGHLIFFKTDWNRIETIKVKFQGGFYTESFTMTSDNKSKINDDHGDITIFNK